MADPLLNNVCSDASTPLYYESAYESNRELHSGAQEFDANMGAGGTSGQPRPGELTNSDTWTGMPTSSGYESVIADNSGVRGNFWKEQVVYPGLACAAGVGGAVATPFAAAFIPELAGGSFLAAAEQSMPFLLWISAAALAHIGAGIGIFGIASARSDADDVRLFVEMVRRELSGENQIIEVTVEEPLKADKQMVASLSDPQIQLPPELKPPAITEKPDPAKPMQVVPLPLPVEKPKIAEQPKQAPKPPNLKPSHDNRIAVKQHVKDKNQPDNPNAKFVGDEANHVKEESVARLTNHERDDPDPTPGTQHASRDREPGNADKTQVAQNENRTGDPDRAPGEGRDKPGKETDIGNEQHDGPKTPETPPAATQTPPAKPQPNDVKPAPAPVPTATATPAPSPAKAPAPPAPSSGDNAQHAPDTNPSSNGAWSINPRRKSGPPSTPAPGGLDPNGILGLGGKPNSRGVQLNLNPGDVAAVVGQDELRRMRDADGERRRSAHRGSWSAPNFERFRAAIENYVASVKPGNQTALNTARVPFASYLVMIHNRIHPSFADGFLDSLDSLPQSNPMNNQEIFTRLEIVVNPKTGSVVRMGVIKTSGIVTFDLAALHSVDRAQPFGKAPDAIVSPDGNVYLHWEFHRNPIYACSTMNARPYMLKNPPPASSPETPLPTPKAPADPREAK